MRNLKARSDMFIIAVFFIGVSALLAWILVVKPISEHYRIGQWDRVPVTITSVKLLENMSSTEAVATYACQASFRYRVGQKTYEADDVSIYEGSDNLSNFQQRIFQELSGYEESGQAFQAYVNPGKPEEALLYRNLRWGVTIGACLLVLLFSAVGVALLVRTGKELLVASRAR